MSEGYGGTREDKASFIVSLGECSDPETGCPSVTFDIRPGELPGTFADESAVAGAVSAAIGLSLGEIA